MRKLVVLVLCCVAFVGTAMLLFGARSERERDAEERERGGPTDPADWFALQRMFPFDSVPAEKVDAALQQAVMERATGALSTSSVLGWEQAGPFNIGGRVTAVAGVPGNASVAYLGSANGGVWKTENGGINWLPISDSQPFFSIGAIALVPGSDKVLYVGTGEANASVDSYDGSGMYRTTDGGGAWEWLGIPETRRIAAIAIDPGNHNRIFAAAMGSQFSTGPHRGLYRSTDYGSSWSKVLFVNDSTGVSDIEINPAHPETMFCATWERVRHYTYRRASGPGCGVWRSVDGGTSWTRLAGGFPSGTNVGRIALAIAPSQPSRIYAQVISSSYTGLGLYRSDNGGVTWTKRDADPTFTNSFGGFGWYFGEMGVSPANPNRIYTLGVDVLRSDDGGVTYTPITSGAHVDQHALWIDPTSANRVILGNDGGFFWSSVGGGAWSSSFDLPLTQFYAMTVDPTNVNRLFGGTQDNNTLRTTSGPSSWAPILGGDGFYCLVDPVNPQVVFAEYQFCCSGTGPRRSTNGGNTLSAVTGFVGSDRYNWSTPMAISATNHNVVIVGSQRVYRSLDNGVNFTPVSGDLTTNPVTALTFGTISTLDISPVDGNTFYAGSDDGKVWRSTDGGTNWADISSGLPVRSITRVSADPVNPAVVYVTLSGFGQDETLAHIYRSTDRGITWTSIAGNLPDVPANDVLADPTNPNQLFLATDVGVFITHNLGATWYPLGQGMPIQTIFDLSLHSATRTLIAATHGRSMWTLSLAQLPVSAPGTSTPPRVELAAPSPNPSRGAVRFDLDLSAPAAVEMSVFDAAGRRVKTLARGAYDAGHHAFAWNGSDDRGSRARAGVYFVRAVAGDATRTQRVVRVD